MAKTRDLRLLARCPVCGSKRGRRCVEINTTALRGKQGGGSLSKFRRTLPVRVPHESRLRPSEAIHHSLIALGAFLTALAAHNKKPAAAR